MKEKRAENRDSESGVTLLEMLIVLAIMGLIAFFAVPNLMKLFGSAKADVAVIQINNLKGAIDIYKLENNTYPTQAQGLDSLVKKPQAAPVTWNGPYISPAEALIDPWGNPYRYRNPGTSAPFDIYSYGADNAEGGDDEDADISS